MTSMAHGINGVVFKFSVRSTNQIPPVNRVSAKAKTPIQNTLGARKGIFFIVLSEFADLRSFLVAKEAHYFIGEKSLGCMYVESTFSTSFSLCSDFPISLNAGSACIASQFFFASSRLG